MDRRKLSRHHFRTEIKFFKDGHEFKGIVSDISLTGIFIETLCTFEVGDRLSFIFSFQGSTKDPIRGEGTIVWIEEHTGIGVRFTHMLKSDWIALHGCLGK